MAKISVVINTLNEEKNLARALESVADWAYEVVVVDMHSDDGTIEIAKKYGAKTYNHKRTGYVEPARNYAISKTSGDWILLLDADEEIPASLRHKLKELVSSPKADYYAIPRKNIVFGKWLKHSRWWPDKNIRFFKKGMVEWAREIHSIPLTQGKGLDLPEEEDFAIIHHNYESVSQYLERLNRYTTVQAKEKKKNDKKYSWKNFISSPTSEFLSRYFAGEGYKDGIHGLALALLQGFSELVVEIKLWELSKFPEREIDLEQVNKELKNSQREINYWTADALVKKGKGLHHRLKRKLKLP